MSRANLDPSEPNRIGIEIGLVFQDQRTGERRQVIYVDSRVVLVRDEAGNTTLTNRESFETELGTRYRRRPDAELDVDGGQYERLRDAYTVYELQEGRKAEHKADALREALDLIGASVADLDDEVVDEELPDDVTESVEETDGTGDGGDDGDGDVQFEEIPGIGPDTAGKLRTSGYTTETDVRSASDDELLAVAGVGPSNLENIREFLDGD